MSEGVDYINKKLVELYSQDIAVSLPNYKVVWTSSQYETRVNPAGFDIYSEEGLFLRTEFGPKEVEKYPLYPDMWVLEVLTPKTREAESLLVEPIKYSYEPLFIFGAGNSNPQPIWRAVNFLVHAHKFKQAVMNRTESDDFTDDLVKLAKEKEECKMFLSNENPPLATALHNKEAIVVP